MIIHKYKKFAKANVEKLADDSQVIQVYAGTPDLGYEVMGRDVGADPTVTAGTSGSAGGHATGTIEEMTAELRYDLKKDGSGPVHELVTRIGISGVDSF